VSPADVRRYLDDLSRDRCDPGCPGWFRNTDTDRIERCDECARIAGIADDLMDEDVASVVDAPRPLRPTAVELLTMIRDTGATVDIVTMTRCYRINRAVVTRFDASGSVILKDSRDGRLMMLSGRRYLDCSHNRLVIWSPDGTARGLQIDKLPSQPQ